MRVAYVAGPYRSTTEWGVLTNIRNAEVIAVELWTLGFAVITPHKNSAFLLGGLAPDETWLNGYLEIVGRCDCVVLVPGWERSSGTLSEIAHAKALGIPVFDWGVESDCRKLAAWHAKQNTRTATKRKRSA